MSTIDNPNVLCETPEAGIVMPDGISYHGVIWVFGPIRTAYVLYRNVRHHILVRDSQWVLTGNVL